MILETAIGILFASLTVAGVMQFLKKVILPWIDRQTPIVQQTVVFILSLLIVPLAAVIGLTLPTDIHLWNFELVNSLLTALGAFGVHSLKKALQAWAASRNS